MRRAYRMFLRQVYAFFMALDLVASALTGGAPMQTISARLAKTEWKPAQAFRRRLDAFVYLAFGELDHCALALEAYEARVRAAPSFEP